ncbi:MAG: hypothetical protein E7149_05885 [Rikenellaceae bacterium]|nr:hypothetical protein [Rikenellaceae bacterium]
MLNPTEQFLLTLLRVALHPACEEPIEVPQGVDWAALYRLATEQGVLAIAWDGLELLVQRGVLPAEAQPKRMLKLQWAVNVQQIEARYGRQREALEGLAGFYAEHDIRLMLLKGYGLSLSYPHPEHRPCGDLDIWLYGEQQRADQLMRAAGVPIDEDQHHHTVFTYRGVMVENHYDFLNVHSHRSNRTIEARLQALAAQGSEPVRVVEQTIHIPSADFNALFLLRHAAAHFAAAEIGLRHLIDWAMFLHRDGERVDWTALMRLAEKVNMHRFLMASNYLVKTYLGIDLPDPLAAVTPNQEEAERVLREILTPAFGDAAPRKNILKIWSFKWRRWWANRWKHRMVYREGLLQTFFVQLWSHLLKPKSFTH